MNRLIFTFVRPAFKGYCEQMRSIFPMLLGIVVLLSQSAPLCAEEATLSLKNGISPDGKYETVVVGDPSYPSDVATIVEVRPSKTKHPIASCGWGYGILNSVPDYAVVLWSPDSKFVAISVRTSKRTFETFLFFIDGKNSKEIKPSSDYFENICGRLGVVNHDFRNLRVTPMNWKDDILTLKVEVPSVTEDVELAFEVTIKGILPFSNRNSGDPESHALVTNIAGPLPDNPQSN